MREGTGPSASRIPSGKRSGARPFLHDTPPAEFVRETILALARNPESGVAGAVAPLLAPLIERMFRYTWFLATEKLDALVAEARALHDSLRRDSAG